MANLGITISDIENTISENLNNSGAGRINTAGEALIVKVQTNAIGIKEIEQIPIPSKNGFAKLSDFAKVNEEYITRLGFATKDGIGEATQGLVLSLKGANAKESIDEIKTRLAELKPNLPDGVNI